MGILNHLFIHPPPKLNCYFPLIILCRSIIPDQLPDRLMIVQSVSPLITLIQLLFYIALVLVLLDTKSRFSHSIIFRQLLLSKQNTNNLHFDGQEIDL